MAVQYKTSDRVKDEVLTQGWHLVSPTTHTTNYTIGIEQSYLTAGNNGDSVDDESFSTYSSEGKDMQIDLTFTYQYNIDSGTKVFTEFKGQSGKEVRDSFIKPNIVSWTKEVIAQYKVDDVLGTLRTGVNSALTEYLKNKFSPYGINISNVSLINIEVDKETSDAINAKITAQQNAETQAINNETNVAKAAADAEVSQAQAQGKADAMLIKAQAEAEAMNIRKEALASMPENYIEQMWIEKWNGALPEVMFGEENIMMSIG